MKFLVIAERWGSFAGIGAIRPMKLTKYLLLKGHSVTVFYGTDISESLREDEELNYMNNQNKFWSKRVFIPSKIFRIIDHAINNRCIVDDLTENKQINDDVSTKKKLMNIIVSFIYRVIYLRLRTADVIHNALIQIKNSNIEPDVIFSTYGPIESINLGKRLKKIYKSSFWVADFRDPIPWYTDSPLVYALNKITQYNICRTANAVTVVSRGMKEEFEADNISRVRVLFNGYDLEDLVQTESNDVNNQLLFTYTGNIYEGKRDLTPFIKALEELILTGEINPNNIGIIYAGRYGKEFNRQIASLLGIIEVRIFGNLKRVEALKLQQHSDILLHATWNSKGNSGVLTGKIYEYMLARKPVISIISGDLPNSEIGEIIRDANIGFVYELANRTNISDLKLYIKVKYEEKMNSGLVRYEGDNNYLARFDYKNLTDELISIVVKTGFGKL